MLYALYVELKADRHPLYLSLAIDHIFSFSSTVLGMSHLCCFKFKDKEKVNYLVTWDCACLGNKKICTYQYIGCYWISDIRLYILPLFDSNEWCPFLCKQYHFIHKSTAVVSYGTSKPRWKFNLKFLITTLYSLVGCCYTLKGTTSLFFEASAGS